MILELDALATLTSPTIFKMYVIRGDRIRIETNTGISETISLSSEDFDTLRNTLCIGLERALDRASSVVGILTKKLQNSGLGMDSEAQLDNALWSDEGLAERGSFALNRFLGNSRAVEIYEWLDRARNEFGLPPKMIVHSDFSHLPWGALYLYSDNQMAGTDRTAGFLGLRCWIVRKVGSISSSPNPEGEKVGALLHAELSHVEDEWATVSENAALLNLEAIRFLDNPNSQQMERIRKVREFMTNPDIQALHLACHFEPNPSDVGASLLNFGNGLLVRQMNLESRTPLDLGSIRVVFLNACETAFVHGGSVINLVDFLIRAGASSVIATECRVRTQLASSVAQEVWNRLGSDESVLGAVCAMSSDATSLPIKVASLGYGVYGYGEISLGTGS